MSPSLLAALVLGFGGISAVGFAVALIGGERPPIERVWRRYAAWADGETRSIFLPWSAARYAVGHAAIAALLALAGAALGGWPLGALAAVGATVAGFRFPGWQRRKRRARLEAQLDPTLRSMAQTLRVTANLADAIETAAAQVDPPMAQEMDLCLRQYRIGLPLEEALRQMGERTGSASVEIVSTAILIARSTGGDLPKILDEVATTLRERVRLDGLVDTKTAEGKAQAWVMGLVPPALGAMLWRLDPEMMRPLLADPVGWAILGVVGLLEVVGVWGVIRVTAIRV